jgi:hypothetical protein
MFQRLFKHTAGPTVQGTDIGRYNTTYLTHPHQQNVIAFKPRRSLSKVTCVLLYVCKISEGASSDSGVDR